MKNQLTLYPIYTFHKSKTKFIASKQITKEFIDLLAQYDEFIISVYIKPLRHSKGTLLWIQNKHSGKLNRYYQTPRQPAPTCILRMCLNGVGDWSLFDPLSTEQEITYLLRRMFRNPPGLSRLCIPSCLVLYTHFVIRNLLLKVPYFWASFE